MDNENEFSALEAELRCLRPRRPGSALERRIAAALAEPSPVAPRRCNYFTATSWTSWKWANWAVAAVLVALMAVAVKLSPPSEHSPSVAAIDADAMSALRPIKAGRTLLGSRVDGVIELDDGSAAKRVRDYFVDTIEWRDPAGQTRLTWSVPRESVRYVGLAAY